MGNKKSKIVPIDSTPEPDPEKEPLFVKSKPIIQNNESTILVKPKNWINK